MTDNKSGEILIIEDDKDINDLLATALSKAGYRTRQAWSGTEGELLLKLDREAYALVLDRISRQLYVADNAVDGITKQEFAILELLMAHPRQVFAKEDIFEYAWDEPYMGETKTLDVHISNIRKKIKRLTDDEYIETVWGIGYKMKE